MGLRRACLPGADARPPPPPPRFRRGVGRPRAPSGRRRRCRSELRVASTRGGSSCEARGRIGGFSSGGRSFGERIASVGKGGREGGPFSRPAVTAFRLTRDRELVGLRRVRRTASPGEGPRGIFAPGGRGPTPGSFRRAASTRIRVPPFAAPPTLEGGRADRRDTPGADASSLGPAPGPRSRSRCHPRSWGFDVREQAGARVAGEGATRAASRRLQQGARGAAGGWMDGAAPSTVTPSRADSDGVSCPD